MFVVGDEAAVFPYVELVVRALAALAEGGAEGFELGLAEGVGEAVEHVLRAAALHLVGKEVRPFEQVAEDLHFRP